MTNFFMQGKEMAESTQLCAILQVIKAIPKTKQGNFGIFDFSLK